MHKLKIIFTTSISLSLTLSLIFTGFVDINAQEPQEYLEYQQQGISYLPLAGLEPNIVEMTNFETVQLTQETNEIPVYFDQVLAMNTEENYQEMAQADEFADPIIIAGMFYTPRMQVGFITDQEIINSGVNLCDKHTPFNEYENNKKNKYFRCDRDKVCGLKYKQMYLKYNGFYKYDNGQCFIMLDSITIGANVKSDAKQYCKNNGGNNLSQKQQNFVCTKDKSLIFRLNESDLCIVLYKDQMDSNYNFGVWYEWLDNSCKQKVQ